MEILKRTHHGNEGEIVSFRENPETVREEVLRRSAKAGHSTRFGEPIHGTKILSRGYGESRLNVWPRDEDGNLME